MNTSPVLVIAFNRPESLKRLLSELRFLHPSTLYIAIDGPRTSHPSEAESVAECIRIASSLEWPNEVKLLVQETNLGCGRAVQMAISWFFDNEPEGIVLEDDMSPSFQFFTFAENALNHFRSDPSIFLVAGCNFVPWASDFFAEPWRETRYPRVWGWVSWRDRWHNYEPEIPCYLSLRRLKRLLRWTNYSLLETFYWARQFQRTRSGKIDTWDYQIVALSVKKGYRFVVSNRNLVANTGWGVGATHTRSRPKFLLPVDLTPYDQARWAMDAPRSEFADSWERRNIFRVSPVAHLVRFVRLFRQDE